MKIINRGIFTLTLSILILAASSCDTASSTTESTSLNNITPSAITVIPPPKTDREKGSAPPNGIGGWEKPRLLTDAEKAKVVEIAINDPTVAAWLQSRPGYSVRPVGWSAIVWNDGMPGEEWSIEYNDQSNLKYISPYAYWYPSVILEAGQGIIYQMAMAVDLDAGKVAYNNGALPSLDSPDRFKTSTPSPLTTASDSSR